jgi:general secretion pathway protein G
MASVTVAVAAAVRTVVPFLSTSPDAGGRKDIARVTQGPNHPVARAPVLYRLTVGTYPKGDYGLKELICRPADPEAASKWKGPYLEDERGLRDPWGNAYRYRCPGKHSPPRYDLWSAGPDGKDGTDDDITNWADLR